MRTFTAEDAKSASRPLLGQSRRSIAGHAVSAAVLTALSAWLFSLSWNVEGNYQLDGDGTRYIQPAMQLIDFHRIGNMPSLGPDLSCIYPPLMPALIAIFRLITGEYYYSAHLVVALTLLGAVLIAFGFGRLLSKAWVPALCSGAAVAFLLIPQNAALVLTEPLNAIGLLGGLAALIAGLESKPGADLKWAVAGGICAAIAILSRSTGVVLIPSMAVGLALTFPRSELGTRWRPLAMIAGGWLAGIAAYVGYEKYMEHLGGIPLQTMVHAFSALLQGPTPLWPIIDFDPQTGLAVPAPDAFSLSLMFWTDPQAYLKLSLVTLKSIFVRWFVILAVIHAIRLSRAYVAGEVQRSWWAFCDIALLAMFFMNTAILVALGQHPLFIERMFEPWAACSLVVLASAICRVPARLAAAQPLVKIGVACALAAIPLTGAHAVRDWLYSISPRGGLIAPEIIDAVKRSVPPGETIISAPAGGPELVATIAGYPNMQFGGPPETFLTQMHAHHLRFALTAPHVTPEVNKFMPACRVIYDSCCNRLMECPIEPVDTGGAAKP